MYDDGIVVTECCDAFCICSWTLQVFDEIALVAASGKAAFEQFTMGRIIATH